MSPDDASARALRRVRCLLAAVDFHYDTLLAATERFDPSFDRDSFVAAASSESPEERVDVDAVERGYEKLVNLMVGIVDAVLREVGDADGEADEDESRRPGRWGRLVALGVFSEDQARELARAVELRNEVQHAYIDIQPALLHDGVSDFLSRYPAHLERLQALVALIED